MPDVQKVLEALPCLASVQHDCLKCSYNPHPGMPWPYGCIKGQGDIVQDAAELLKALERPRGRWVYKDRHRKSFRLVTGYDSMGDVHTITICEESQGKEPYCGICGAQAAESFMDYCPHCGAIMDKEDDSIA